MFRQVNDLFFEKLPKSDFVVAQGKTDLTKLTDGVISNRDARAIVDENGQVLFYYTFVNDDHLLLAERTEIVNEIATKLNLKNLVR
jgi:spore maturation protein CgeB